MTTDTAPRPHAVASPGSVTPHKPSASSANLPGNTHRARAHSLGNVIDHKANSVTASTSVRSSHTDSAPAAPTDAFGNHKPRMRGWQHAVMLPISAAITTAISFLAPTTLTTVASIIFGIASASLFSISAMLHVGHWRNINVVSALCRIDYANIFFLIAATNTPIIIAAHPPLQWAYLAAIWFATILGGIARNIWMNAPDWTFTIVYVVLGLSSIAIIPLVWASLGAIPALLIIAGGLAYIAGAACFALRKPNPIPNWFEYHEVFHLGTVLGYLCHASAIALIMATV